MQNKTICIFSTFAYPHIGGVELFTHQIAKRFVQRGAKVLYICLNTENISNIETLGGITYFRLPSISLINGRFPIPIISSRFFKIFKQINNFSIDFLILNVRFYLFTLIGSWYAKLKKIPAIIIEHGTGHIDFENSLINIIAATYEHVITYFIKLTSLKFYGVSKACTQWLLHFGIQPSGVIYNGVDTSYQLKTFLRYRSIHNLPKNAIVITFVGRLIVEKGVLELIEAVKSLLHAYKNLYLMIAGDGPLKSRINKLPKRIIYLGRVEHDNVMGLLSETDILVLPSRFPEGLPTILLEAGSIGCAVIATPKGGTKEVITDERFGIIIDNNEILTIRKALISLINNPEKRADLAENLRKRIRENFDWEIIFNRLINEVINNGIKA